MVLTALVVVPSAAQVRITGRGPSRCITVNGRPMIMLAGELSNSAATCKADIDSVLPRMSREGLNTVLVPAQWDLTEPTEGRFDFSLIDETINVARQNNLKVVFLWFGVEKLHELLCAVVAEEGHEAVSTCCDSRRQAVGDSFGLFG